MSTTQASEAVKNLNHIPGKYGLPLLGRTLEAVKDMECLLNDMYDRFGPLSKTSLGFHDCVFALHPDHLKEVLMDKDKNFSSKGGYETPFGEYFEGAIVVDFEEHLHTRRIFQSSFKPQQIAAHVQTMNEYFSKEVRSWPDQEQGKLFYPIAKPLLLDCALEMFIGMDTKKPGFVAQMNQAFTDIIEGLMAVVKLKIPGTLYNRAQKADAFLEDYLHSEIEIRLANDKTDTFSLFCREKDEDGNYFSDQCIVANIKNLIFASYDTASSAVCNMLMRLADNPEYQEKVREECRQQVGEDGFICAENLSSMPFTDICFDETERMHPPISIIPRKALRDFTLGGYSIPAGTIVYVSPYHIHYNTDYYTNPKTFDPERFLPGREEHKTYPYCYAPFGAGAHKCIGMHMAKAFVKTFISQILLHYDVRLTNGKVSDVLLVPVPKPKDDLPIDIKRI